MAVNPRSDARLLILRALYKQPGYVANQEVLLAKLRELGYPFTRDVLHIELAWLDQVADVIVDQVSGGVHIATLTGDGLDVVEGLREIPGIRRPRPDELQG
ncbi:ArsR family transcriptional regulator [Methylobacter sp.]|uniref:VpaChn25_0724 family phage protein n=1 Tax=Methylobacter sp. TaxID=2051955 RepID=UPI002487BD21|nr:ArsR family transcriptional regulator [Methylobacter sp.]MDI1278033.1 ArsR family transcriptional regulator [Methylobacter sp.]